VLSDSCCRKGEIPSSTSTVPMTNSSDDGAQPPAVLLSLASRSTLEQKAKPRRGPALERT